MPVKHKLTVLKFSNSINHEKEYFLSIALKLWVARSKQAPCLSIAPAVIRFMFQKNVSNFAWRCGKLVNYSYIFILTHLSRTCPTPNQNRTHDCSQRRYRRIITLMLNPVTKGHVTYNFHYLFISRQRKKRSSCRAFV